MKKILTLFTALLLLGSFTVVKADYYVAGTMNGWTSNSNDWKMSGSDPSSVTKQMAPDTYQFKVTSGSWSWSTASFDNSLSNVTLSTNGGNIQFTISTTSDVTFYYNGSNVYVQATPVSVPSYTFPAGTTIYYDFTGYGAGVNVYNSDWNNEWKDNSAVASVFSKTLSNAWEVTASTVLFRSAASNWNNVLCSTLPTEGQNMIVSTNGSTFTWGTYSGSTPDPTPATIKMHGNFLGDWANTNAFTIADGNATASLTLNITSTGTKNFGMRIGSDDNWTSNGASITRASSSAAITSGSGNCSLNVDVTGEYTFTWTYATNTLSVAYPALPTYTVAFDGLASSLFTGDAVTFAATSTGVANPAYTFKVKKGDAAYGSAVSSYTFAEAGTYTVKVEVRENGASGDALASQEQTITVSDPLTLYFVNKDAWANVNIYFYNPNKTDWPGDAMTATGDVTEGHNYAVYSYTVASSYSSANVIFNNGSGTQTADLTVNSKHYFFDGEWYNTLAEIDPSSYVDFDGVAATVLVNTPLTLAATSNVTGATYNYYVKPEGGDYEAISSPHTFNAIGKYTLKVEALENGAGEPVAYREKDIEVYTTYTFTNGTKIFVDFSAMTEGDKGVNWPSVDAANVGGSTWQYDENGAGSVKTVTFTTDVTWSTLYNFINTQKNGWNGLKFKVPAAGENCALVNAAGNDYTWTTRIPTITLHSNFTNPSWEESAAFVLAGNEETASLTITINQGESYQFGVKVDGDWRANGAAFDRFNNSVVIPAGNTSNCTFVADATGEYTFTWTFATNTLSVVYPEALSVALTGLNASQFVGDEVTVGASSNLTNVSYAYQLKIDDGEFAALSANPYTFAAAGTYTFKVTATGDEGVVNATKEVTVYEQLTLYFINKDSWSNVYAYAYDENNTDIKNANWPGQAMTATGDVTAGHSYDAYSVTIAKDRYTIIIFNDNSSQTDDLTFDEALPYFYNGIWYATLAECDPAAPAKETYHLYVREYVGWDEFDVYAWGDDEYFGNWPGKTAADNTVVIDGATYSVYDFEAVPGDITMHLIFNNNGPGEYQEGDYRQLLDITEAKNCTISVSDFAAWEGLSGVKRFRACEALEHVYGYQWPDGGDWPGAELTPDANGWYSYIVSKGHNVIFNNGTGADAMQTGDLSYTDEHPFADECAVWQGETNVSDKTYMVTSDDCDAACLVSYERDVTAGNYGTICLPYNATSVTGATLYSIAGKSEGCATEGIFIDQEDNLLMGVPYIFLANADKLVVRYWEGQTFVPSGDHLYSHNGLVGFINDGEFYTVTPNANNFILYNNGLYYVNSTVMIASNRAFIDWSDIPTAAAPAPGVIRRVINVQQTATGMEATTADEIQSVKVIRNGVLFIERNGNTYNAVGQKVK